MCENRDFVVPVNILTPFAHAPFSWAARHTTVCLDLDIVIFNTTLLSAHVSDLLWIYLKKRS